MIERIYEVTDGHYTARVNDEELAEILKLKPNLQVKVFCASEVKEEKRGGKQNLL